jgi:DNA (cytosine-5)-methyltransferase 1
LSSYKGKQRKDTIARNLVDYEVGKTILDLAMGVKPITKQINIFDEQY